MLKPMHETGPSALAQCLRPFVRETPLVMIKAQDFGLSGLPIALKLELLQYAGNSKLRAAEAFCQKLTANVTTVASACAPEDAIALSYVARRRGLICRIHVATATLYNQVANMRRSHPDLIFDARADVRRRRSAMRWARRHGAAYYDPERHDIAFDAMGIMGLELQTQLGEAHADIDTLLVPVATGVTIAGLARWLADRDDWRRLKLVGVEPYRAPAFHAAKRSGAPRKVDVSGITVGVQSTRRTTPQVFRAINQASIESVLVSDANIVEAQLLLWNQLRMAADAKGALGVAALISGAYVADKNERLGVLIPSAHLGVIDWDHSE